MSIPMNLIEHAYEWQAWLGPATLDMSDAQLTQFITCATTITDLYDPDDPDDADGRERALSAALQVILGETTLEDVGAAEQRAYAAYVHACDATTGALVAERANNRPITNLAATAGVTRQTVYKRLTPKERR